MPNNKQLNLIANVKLPNIGFIKGTVRMVLKTIVRATG